MSLGCGWATLLTPTLQPILLAPTRFVKMATMLANNPCIVRPMAPAPVAQRASASSQVLWITGRDCRCHSRDRNVPAC